MAWPLSGSEKIVNDIQGWNPLENGMFIKQISFDIQPSSKERYGGLSGSLTISGTVQQRLWTWYERMYTDFQLNWFWDLEYNDCFLEILKSSAITCICLSFDNIYIQ